MPICPHCEQEYTERPALSRRDNQTLICPACGTAEAMEVWARALETSEIHYFDIPEQAERLPQESTGEQEQEREPPEMYLCRSCGQHHPIATRDFYCPLDPNKPKA